MAESIDTQLEATWYVAANDGQADGPLRIQDIKQRLREGTYTTTQLAWRPGMTDWLPITSITEFGIPASTGSSRAFTWPSVGMLSMRAAGDFTLLLIVGRTALAIALLTIAISMLALLWGRSWFEHAYFLILIFAICEGQAGIWKALSAQKLATAPRATAEQTKE